MGHWEEIQHPWYETRIVNCSFCGRMIARRMWIAEGSEPRVFCGKKCEQLSGRFEDERARED